MNGIKWENLIFWSIGKERIGIGGIGNGRNEIEPIRNEWIQVEELGCFAGLETSENWNGVGPSLKVRSE